MGRPVFGKSRKFAENRAKKRFARTAPTPPDLGSGGFYRTFKPLCDYIRWTDFHLLREEYHKTGGPVVTHFPYFLYFPN